MSKNRSFKSTIYRFGSVGLLTGSLWFSAAPVLQAQQQGSQSDATLQSNVTNTLSQDSTLQGQQVTATVTRGQVTLSGTVQTNAQRQQAETLAASAPGVSGILNNITVADPNSPLPVVAQNQDPQNQAAQPTAPQNDAPAPPADQAPAPPSDQAPAAAQQAQSYPNQGDNAPPPPPDDTAPRTQYQSQQRSYAAPQPPSGPVVVPAGTLVRVRLSETLDTAHLQSGAYFQATAAADVYTGGVLAIPRGAVLNGQVVEAKKGGELGGAAVLQLKLNSLSLGGSTYVLNTDTWSNKGPNKAGYTAANTIGGAAVGALIGGIIGRGAGAAIGAGVGAGAGLATSAATNGPRLILPTETAVDFHLATPVTVQPVSWQEAQRLATASTPQQPRLYRRPYPYPYAYGYPAPPPPPGYYSGYPY